MQALNASTAIPETQGAPPALAPAVLAAGTSAEQPAPAVGEQGGREEGGSSDDEDFEIPAIDPTMDTDDEDEDADDDG